MLRGAAVASGGVLAGALAGCGQSGGPADTGASKQPVELTLAVRNIEAEVKSWEDVFKVFVDQSNGKYTGNFLPAPAGEVEYLEKVSTLMAGGTPPDVFFLLARAKADFVERKLVMDLTQRMAKSKTAKPDIFFKPMQEAMQYKGKYWGTAEDYNSTVLFINLSLLKEKGIAKPSLNWTYDDYRELARKMRQPEKNVYGGSNWMTGTGPAQLATTWSHGKHLYIDEQKNKAMVNSPQSIQAHQLFQQMAFADRSLPSPLAPQQSGQGGDQGYYAVWNGWANKPWQLHQANKGTIPYEWAMHTFPKGPQDQRQGAQGHLYAIPNAGLKSPDAAWTLAEWIGGLEGWKQFVKIGKGIPLPIADRALWESYYDFLPKEKANELIYFVNKQLYPQFALNVSYPPYYDEVNKILTDALRPVYSQDQVAPKTALDDAARKIDAVLEDYKRRTGT
ncbi:MAG TPA: hypothetical protein VFN74_05400 [Chloroflexota bacterium]|nr:hypothetical protein [Chloroflexota bacterium]